MNWDRKEIIEILTHPDGFTDGYPNRKIIYRMLQAMMDRQTPTEQTSELTMVWNGVGFNGVDAPFLTSVAKRSRQYGNLTPKQAYAVGKRLRKYVGQLVQIAESKKVPVVSNEGEAGNCSYCGEGLPHCRCYWKAEYQKRENAQEQAAFEAGMDAEMRGR